MENKEKKMLTTEDLNRTLGKKELYSIAFGHVIGSGVFSLIGIGIGYTGKSAWIGILLSAVFILLQALPFIVMAGTARFRGGVLRREVLDSVNLLDERRGILHVRRHLA